VHNPNDFTRLDFVLRRFTVRQTMEKPVAINDEKLARDLLTFNVRQAARALSVHPESIRDFLRSGRIPGIRVGNRWRVTAEVLAQIVKEGVPSKPRSAIGEHVSNALFPAPLAQHQIISPSHQNPQRDVGNVSPVGKKQIQNI